MSLHYITGLISNRAGLRRRPRRPALVVLLKQLGDLVLLQPAVKALADRCLSPVVLTSQPAFEPVVELMDHAVFEAYPVGYFDDVWTFEPGSKAAAKVLLVRAGRKKLFLRDEDRLRPMHKWLYDETVALTGARHEYNALFYYRAVVKGDSGFRPPKLKLPPEHWRSSLQPGKPYLVVNAVSSLPSKSWTAANWLAALDVFLRQRPMTVVFTGMSLEWQLRHIEEIVRRCPSPIISAAGRTSIREYLALLANSRCVLTVDGAAAHLAQAFDRPMICLFTRHSRTASVNWSYPGPRTVTFAENAARAGEHVRVRPELSAEEVASEALRLCWHEESDYRNAGLATS